MHAEDQAAVRLLRQGASAYLTKERAVDELQTAIAHVMAGGRYLSPALAELAMQSVRAEPESGLPSLSPREYQVLQLLARGQAVKEIARHLCLSVKTVSTFRARVLKKLGLHNNAQLIAYALANGLIV
jgi:DNA-binding NarL/FixJ family response regulator